MDLNQLEARISAARAEAEARGETFYPGASRIHLAAFPPKERWDDWVELDSKSWPRRVEKRYVLVPTTCFNCESACGLLAYVDKATLQVRKFEGNPEHPGSRGRNCAKGPATLNQVTGSKSSPMPATGTSVPRWNVGASAGAFQREGRTSSTASLSSAPRKLGSGLTSEGSTSGDC